jgi:hypothetical protein
MKKAIGILAILGIVLTLLAATTYQTIQFRRGTSTEWTAVNPVPSQGEPGFETDTQKFKIGDGLLHWNNLPDFQSTTAIINAVYPVGSIYISTVATNPATLLGVGTWTAFGAGRVLVGLDAGQTEFDTVEETGGEKTHVLSEAELPAHNHNQTEVGSGFTGYSYSGTGGDSNWPFGGGTTAKQVELQAVGSGAAHNNLQPYIVVYMWKRTA